MSFHPPPHTFEYTKILDYLKKISMVVNPGEILLGKIRGFTGRRGRFEFFHPFRRYFELEHIKFLSKQVIDRCFHLEHDLSGLGESCQRRLGLPQSLLVGSHSTSSHGLGLLLRSKSDLLD